MEVSLSLVKGNIKHGQVSNSFRFPLKCCLLYGLYYGNGYFYFVHS